MAVIHVSAQEDDRIMTYTIDAANGVVSPAGACEVAGDGRMPVHTDRQTVGAKPMWVLCAD